MPFYRCGSGGGGEVDVPLENFLLGWNSNYHDNPEIAWVLTTTNGPIEMQSSAGYNAAPTSFVAGVRERPFDRQTYSDYVHSIFIPPYAYDGGSLKIATSAEICDANSGLIGYLENAGFRVYACGYYILFDDSSKEIVVYHDPQTCAKRITGSGSYTFGLAEDSRRLFGGSDSKPYFSDFNLSDKTYLLYLFLNIDIMPYALGTGNTVATDTFSDLLDSLNVILRV